MRYKLCAYARNSDRRWIPLTMRHSDSAEELAGVINEKMADDPEGKNLKGFRILDREEVFA